MVTLTSGGYGAAKETALSAGKTVTPKLLSADELRKVKRRKLTSEDWDAFYGEVFPEETYDEED